MTPGKRLCDVTLGLMLAVLLVLPLAIIVGLMWLVQGRPILHVAERMRAPDRPFQLLKLRTMTLDPCDSGVTGGDKDRRVTPLGRVLRRTRADEIPQLWNILRGDMSFVGPRPPLRQYVERFPDLYARVLRMRPGLTGLATLHFHDREARLLSVCRSAAETDAVYARICVPQKARLDLLYQARQSLWRDLGLIAATILGLGGFSRLRRKRP